MIRAQLARDLAVQRAKQLSLSSELESSSDAKGRIRLVKMYLKAAAELDKGNVPHWTPSGYLVESRSSLVGDVGRVELIEPTGEISDFVKRNRIFLSGEFQEATEIEPSKIKLYFTITGGDVFLYDPLLHRCFCEAGDTGCWHGTSVEVWEMAGELMLTEEEMNSVPLEPTEDWMEVDPNSGLPETTFFVGENQLDAPVSVADTDEATAMLHQHQQMQ